MLGWRDQGIAAKWAAADSAAAPGAAPAAARKIVDGARG